jgi:hypothetical protein
MRWLVLIILFVALRLFGVDSMWAGAIAYVVFSVMGQSQRPSLVRSPPRVQPPSHENDQPAPEPANRRSVPSKQLTEDIDQIMAILKRALRTLQANGAVEPENADAKEERAHLETLLDFALSSVWPRIREQNARVRYDDPNDSELVREFDGL